MNLFLSSYFISLVTLTILDGIWLGLFMKTFYAQHLAHLLAPTFNLIPAIIFYLAYPVGISILVILPTIHKSLLTTALMGALLGFIAYGTYDFTNHATLKAWPLSVTIVDLIWGTLVTSSVATITTVLLKTIGK